MDLVFNGTSGTRASRRSSRLGLRWADAPDQEPRERCRIRSSTAACHVNGRRTSPARTAPVPPNLPGHAARPPRIRTSAAARRIVWGRSCCSRRIRRTLRSAISTRCSASSRSPFWTDCICKHAVRHEEFSGDLGATVYKLSGKWNVWGPLSFRGSYGTNYQAPPLGVVPGAGDSRGAHLHGGRGKLAGRAVHHRLQPEARDGEVVERRCDLAEPRLLRRVTASASSSTTSTFALRTRSDRSPIRTRSRASCSTARAARSRPADPNVQPLLNRHRLQLGMPRGHERRRLVLIGITAPAATVPARPPTASIFRPATACRLAVAILARPRTARHRARNGFDTARWRRGVNRRRSTGHAELRDLRALGAEMARQHRRQSTGSARNNVRVGGELRVGREG